MLFTVVDSVFRVSIRMEAINAWRSYCQRAAVTQGSSLGSAVIGRGHIDMLVQWDAAIAVSPPLEAGRHCQHTLSATNHMFMTIVSLGDYLFNHACEHAL